MKLAAPVIIQKFSCHNRTHVTEEIQTKYCNYLLMYIKGFNTTLFPGGPPPQYWASSNRVNFGDRTRTGALRLIWSNPSSCNLHKSTACGDRTRDQRIKSPTLYLTELTRHTLWCFTLPDLRWVYENGFNPDLKLGQKPPINSRLLRFQYFMKSNFRNAGCGNWSGDQICHPINSRYSRFQDSAPDQFPLLTIFQKYQTLRNPGCWNWSKICACCRNWSKVCAQSPKLDNGFLNVFTSYTIDANMNHLWVM